jgi:hypothetical protein
VQEALETNKLREEKLHIGELVRLNPSAGIIKLLLSYASQFGIFLSGDFKDRGSFNSQSSSSNPGGAEIDSYLDKPSSMIPHFPTWQRSPTTGIGRCRGS